MPKAAWWALLAIVGGASYAVGRLDGYTVGWSDATLGDDAFACPDEIFTEDAS